MNTFIRTRFRLALITLIFFWLCGSLRAEDAPASPNDSQVDFNTFSNYELAGENLRELSSTNPADCEKACRDDAVCKGYSIDKLARICRLKSSVTDLRFDPRLSSGLPAKSAQPRASDATIVLECRTGHLEGKNTDTPASTTPEACENSCEKNADCLGFEFDPEKKSCQVFLAIDQFSTGSKAIVGIKHQLSPDQTDGNISTCRSPATAQIEDLLNSTSYDRGRLADARATCSAAFSCPKQASAEIERRLAVLDEEQKSFDEAGNDRDKLVGYIVKCVACEFLVKAKDTVAGLEPPPEAKPSEPEAKPSEDLGLAVAVGNIGGGRVQSWGSANYPTVDLAKQAALQLCQANAKGCKVAGSSGPGCIAVAAFGRIWSLHGGETEEEAASQALAACKRQSAKCVVFGKYCNKS